MDQRVKMRLLLVGGTIMFILTVLIVLYGFRRTEELRTQTDVEILMGVPKRAAFGGAPVGLLLGAGSPAEPAEGSAEFDDGLIATLVGVEQQPCPSCDGQKELVAVIKLQRGSVPESANAFARLSVATSPQWGDYGYLFNILDIGAGYVVFSVDGPTPQ